jgi:hypothetical protein
MKRQNPIATIAEKEDTGTIASVIDAQLTAYDVDKVVEQLSDKFRFVRTDEDLEWNRAIYDAIKIVKGGGVDGN